MFFYILRKLKWILIIKICDLMIVIKINQESEIATYYL